MHRGKYQLYIYKHFDYKRICNDNSKIYCTFIVILALKTLIRQECS